ncbi:MAG: response regulator [Desulfobacteraceae bacterium]|jgi:signal transduction histidine kinase|nr:MAG: response regulator [Desulfobacteraceae bacterium]
MENQIAENQIQQNQTEWTIVLIDDEQDIREVVGIALEDAGYRVFSARDGLAGVKLVQEHMPQIVLTDIRMPVMDGLQVLETLKRDVPETEVIVITAFADMPLAIRALQLDASDFITKPLDHEALHLALRRAMDRYTSRKQVRDYMALLERDIENQARMMQQEKLMSIGRLSAGVAHEINNPLTTILTSAMLIQEDLDPQDPIYAELDTISKETLRCRKIVQSLLDFARQSAPMKKDNNINEIIIESVYLTKKQAEFSNIKLKTILSENLPPVIVDKDQIQQTLINLILNAVEATESGGAITVSTQYRHLDRMNIIKIDDTGRGIPKEHLDKIFDPFFTTRENGTGLGLSITHSIIEQHDGRIIVDSTPGKGTCFTIMLPVKTEQAHVC